MAGRAADFSGLVSQLVRKLHLLDRNQKVCHGVTMPQCYVIESLSRQGPLTMKALSAQTGVARSTMTRVVDVLVRDALVVRGPSPHDRRQVLIDLTVDGRRTAEKLQECSRQYSQIVMENIPASKRRTVAESVTLIIAALDNAAQECCN